MRLVGNLRLKSNRQKYWCMPKLAIRKLMLRIVNTVFLSSLIISMLT